MLLFNAGCSIQRFFYLPNRVLYADPAQTSIPHDIVQYPSLNGKKLVGLYFRAGQQPRGVVVHFHGNFGNMSNHFPAAIFLVKQGFDVLAFDYQGYGASEGRPSPKNLLEDGIASVRFAAGRAKERGASCVVVFGQSLGGATAIQVAAAEPLVQAAVIEAAFTSHRAMARDVLGRSLWTWTLYPWAPFLTNYKYTAIKAVSRISPRPVLFVHGDQDKVVPLKMSKQLYAAARDPKSLWIVPGANHMQCAAKAGIVYDKKIADFFAGKN